MPGGGAARGFVFLAFVPYFFVVVGLVLGLFTEDVFCLTKY